VIAFAAPECRTKEADAAPTRHPIDPGQRACLPPVTGSLMGQFRPDALQKCWKELRSKAKRGLFPW